MKKVGFIVLSLALFGVVFLGGAGNAAEQYPVKPINMVIPLEAGSDADIITRPLCQKASEYLGKPITITNKPGAASTIGYMEVNRSKPDGYTIGQATAAMLTGKFMGISPLTYKDFTLIGTYYRMPALVFGSMKTKRPFKTIQEVVSYAKAHPGEVSLSASAVGQSLWVGAMAFISGTGIEVNVIPQAGGSGFTITQIAGGHADLAVTHLAAARPQMQAGNIRMLAVLGDERAQGYETIPTLKEAGYNATWESTGFIIGPPGMPKDVSAKLVKAFEMAANDAGYKKFLQERFSPPFYIPPAQMAEYFDKQSTVVEEIMRKAGVLKK